MEERSKRMDMYLRSVEGATKGGSDDGTEQGAWGSLGGESHIKLPVCGIFSGGKQMLRMLICSGGLSMVYRYSSGAWMI